MHAFDRRERKALSHRVTAVIWAVMEPSCAASSRVADQYSSLLERINAVLTNSDSQGFKLGRLPSMRTAGVTPSAARSQPGGDAIGALALRS
jgi:hypothetical protein